jgi:hypothetical protein
MVSSLCGVHACAAPDEVEGRRASAGAPATTRYVFVTRPKVSNVSQPIIEILYFADCPRWSVALERVHEAVSLLGLDGSVEIRHLLVETEALAHEVRFAGSPTVRVNGRDVEPAHSENDADFGLRCRVYRSEGRSEPAPPVAWIKEALLAAEG